MSSLFGLSTLRKPFLPERDIETGSKAGPYFVEPTRPVVNCGRTLDYYNNKEGETRESSLSVCLQRLANCFGPLAGPALLLLNVSLFALGITYFVYTIIALARTNYYHQKDICGESNAWIFVLLHPGLSNLCFNPSAQKKDTENKDLGLDLCCSICGLLGGFGLTAWGIYELFGVACVDDLKGKLLYLMLAIGVSLDIIALGLLFIALVVMLFVACCCKPVVVE